jgi:creatinine amidohydrolase
MSAAETRAELLSPAELDAALERAPIVYVPLGSLEFHGPHLPIGLDSLNAHGVCTAAAQRAGGIVLPVIYQGIGGGHGDYPWSIMMAGPTGLSAHLRTTLERLEGFGVRTAVLFTGHFAPEQLDVVDEVAAAWNATESALRVVGTGVNRCPDAPFAPDHAGVFESTLLYAIAPDLVHVDRLPPLAERPAVDPGDDPYGLHRHEPDHPLWGVFGADPRPADFSRSAELLNHLGAWLAGLARA